MLFRQEALKARATKLYGDVIIISSLPLKLVILLLSSVVFLAVTFVVLGSYLRTQSVAGYIVPSQGLVRVYPSQLGILENFAIDENQAIQKGQVLGTIMIEKAAQGANTPEAILLKFILQREQNIELQIKQEVEKYELEFRQNKQAASRIDEELAALDEQLITQKVIFEAAEDKYDVQEKLLKEGHISHNILLQHKSDTLTLKRQYLQFKQSFVALTAKKQLLLDRVELMPKTHERLITQLNAQLADVAKQGAELDGQRVYEIKAPISGRASAIRAVSGRTVHQNKSILSILPENSQLEAELFIPSRAIGFVKQGQEVRLLYDAFPYQRFGSHTGIIKSISASIMLPNESDAPIDIKQPVYKVIVSLERAYVEAYEQKFPLQTGMLLNANIILERRTFLDWILDPLRAVGRRS